LLNQVVFAKRSESLIIGNNILNFGNLQTFQYEDFLKCRQNQPKTYYWLNKIDSSKNNCNIKKLKKLIKHIIKNNNVPNRTLGYSNYNENLDKIVTEISKIECVEDVKWDKCAMKPAIYPGTATIGVKYFSNEKLIEQCFHVSQDKMLYFKIFNWYRHLIKYKYALVYIGTKNCPDFFEREKENCDRIH
jgi:uncharacterized protein YqfB (UPF0267 family)